MPAFATTPHPRQGESRYGTAESQTEDRLPKDTGHGVVSAVLHKLTDVVRAMLERVEWIVPTESLHEVCGRMYLELVSVTPAEAQRA